MFSSPHDSSQLGSGLDALTGLGPPGGAWDADGDACAPEVAWVATARGEILACHNVATAFTAEEIQTLSQDVSQRLRRDETVRLSVEMRLGRRVVAAQRIGAGRQAMCLGCVLPAQAAGGGDAGPATSEIVSRAFAWAMVRSRGENVLLKTRANHLKSENQTLRLAHAETVEAAIREREGRRRATHKNKVINKLYHAEEAANRTKNLFLATVSHELRTPLTAILGFTEILLGNLADSENRDAARIIHRNGEHLLAIINDILDLCKLDADRLQIQPASCALVPVLQGVMSLMQVRADAKGLPLILECEQPLPETIVTDTTRFRQILLNLIGNAVKFTETGFVRVVARMTRGGDDRPLVQVDVVDTGIGITQEQIVQLFQPFAQATAETHLKYGGTGLGLTISRRLANMLGGDITVCSEPRRGSTFTVSISAGPVVSGPAVVEQHGPSTSPPAAETDESAPLDCRVLLAEDGPDNQRLIAFILKKAGAMVTIACNGAEAVDAVLGGRPGERASAAEDADSFDVVLMDLQMPVMDGYAATSRLRAGGFQGPIVALSAHTSDDAIQQANNAGCDHYMTKPIDRKRLIELIRQCVAEHRRG